LRIDISKLIFVPLRWPTSFLLFLALICAMSFAFLFTTNPEKAWVEKFFLAYTPIWIALMAVMMFTGWAGTWGNAALLTHSLVVALPVLLIPAFLARRHPSSQPWYQRYWFKANVYLALFSLVGNYFGSEYFFDVLGMVYKFTHASTTWDSALLGSGKQPVPLIMYFYTQAYFMTYHATGNIALRQVQRLRLPAPAVFFGLAVFVIGYLWAWAETKAMANPMMADLFYYEKMELMLRYGSAIYALYFIASFPIYSLMDEKPEKPWSLAQAAAGALSAGMLTLFLLDFAAKWLGRL
jgi:cycloeucalenol cycloisomerase